MNSKPTISSPDLSISWGPEPGAPDPAGTNFDTMAKPVGDDAGADPRVDGPAANDEIMSRDDFFEMFSGLIESPNVVLILRKEDPLMSLVVDPADPAARKASDALYKTCMKVRWLRFMLAPEAEWIKDLMAVGLFVWGKYRLVRAELDERRKIKNGQDSRESKDTSQDPNQSKTSTAPKDEAPGVDQGVVVLKVGGVNE